MGAMNRKGREDMANHEVRVPRQKRAQAKKDAIVQASYALFCEKGYYGTNTAEIAKQAGVSTGIVYSYFQDKKDILNEVVRLYLARLREGARPLLAAAASGEDLAAVTGRFLDLVLGSHQMDRAAHNEFLALALRHEDIGQLFAAFEDELLHSLAAALQERRGLPGGQLVEKLRIGYGIVEKLCHYVMNGRIDENDWPATKAIAVSVIVRLLEAPAP